MSVFVLYVCVLLFGGERGCLYNVCVLLFGFAWCIVCVCFGCVHIYIFIFWVCFGFALLMYVSVIRVHVSYVLCVFVSKVCVHVFSEDWRVLLGFAEAFLQLL